MRLLGAGAWVFAGKMLAAGCYVLLNAFLAKTLAPDEVGLFFVAWSVVSAAALAGLLGTNHAAVRYIAAAVLECDTGGLVRTVLRLMLVGGAGLALAAVAVYWAAPWLFSPRVFDTPQLAGLGLLLAAWVVFAGMQLLLAEAFRGLNQIAAASMLGGGQVGGVAGMLLALALIFAWWLFAGVESLAEVLFLVVSALAVVAVASIPLLLRAAARVRAEGQRPGVLWQTGPLGAFLVVTLSQYLFQQADLWVVGISASVAELAVYGSASRLVFIVALPLMVLNGVLPAIIVRLYRSNDLARLEQLLRASASIAAFVTAVLLVVFAAAGEWLLAWLFTPEYAHGARVLVILAAGRLVSALAGSCSLTLMMTGHQRTVMAWNLACGVGCVALAFPVARLAGPEGVAWVFAVAMAVQNIVMAGVVRRRLGIACHAGGGHPREWLQLVRAA